MAEVVFDQVKKRYGDVQALHALDLTIDNGEFVVLVGPSGCGKTTALRCLAGLERVTDGVIRIGDRDVTHDLARERDLAMVFQSYALYPHMSVRENIAFGLRIRRTDKAEAERRVNEAAAMLGLDHMLDRKPRQLSGGQRQRVSLGRAIVREPKAFLMDEPLSNLDAQLRVQMRAEIVELQRRLEATMIYVTHDQVEAMTMGDRIAVMRDGVLQQHGTPKEVYRNPANLFVASFMGSPAMNIVPARIEPSAMGLRVHADGIDLRLSADKAARLEASRSTSRDVLVGVRPEDFTPQLNGRPPEGHGTVRLPIRLVETLGAESLLHLAGPRDRPIVARLPGDVTADVGDNVALTVDGGRVYVFDLDTEETLA